MMVYDYVFWHHKIIQILSQTDHLPSHVQYILSFQITDVEMTCRTERQMFLSSSDV